MHHVTVVEALNRQRMIGVLHVDDNTHPVPPVPRVACMIEIFDPLFNFLVAVTLVAMIIGGHRRGRGSVTV